MSLSLEHLTHPTAADHARIQAIYFRNFELVDQKPYAIIERGVAERWIELYVTREPSGSIIGFASLVRLPNADAMYLVYFAVDSTLQGQGLGGQMFHALAATLKANIDCSALVWEVHPPRPDDPAHNDSRRVRFYQRQGAGLLALAQPYRMPGSEGDIVPMCLMWLPLRAPGGSPDSQRATPPDKTEIIAWITGIYHWVYPGCEDVLASIIADITALEEHNP